MYKDNNQRLRVFSAEEEEQAFKDDWMSGEEFISLLKGVVKEVAKKVPVVDDVLESIPELQPKVSLEDEYEDATGKPAFWKGKETAKFKKWKKEK